MEWLKKLIKFQEGENIIFYIALVLSGVPTLWAVIEGLIIISNGSGLLGLASIAGSLIGWLIGFIIWFYPLRWIRNIGVRREKLQSDKT